MWVLVCLQCAGITVVVIGPLHMDLIKETLDLPCEKGEDVLQKCYSKLSGVGCRVQGILVSWA